MDNFSTLISTFQPTIFTWSYYCDFQKIINHSFKVRVILSLLNSLLWQENIEEKFISLIKQYPEIREILPILLAVRDRFWVILDYHTKDIKDVSILFNKNILLTNEIENELLLFFNQSGLKKIFYDKNISNLNDYIFWVETWLDTNARKNRTWSLMEHLVWDFISNFCQENWYLYKNQATAKWINSNRDLSVQSDKSSRIFDFAIYTWTKLFLIETNFYGSGWSKLKSVAGEFSNLYRYLDQQDISLLWITDGIWWKTALKPLEEAYNATDGNICNIQMLKDWFLENFLN